MLKAINTKILIAILAALTAIGSAVIYQSNEAHKAAAILQQQRHDVEEQRSRDEAFRKQVEQDKRHNSAAGNEGKTWKSYIP